MTTFLTTTADSETRPHHSSGVAVGDYVFATGMAVDASSGVRVPEAKTVADEVRICFIKIEDVLRQAGLTADDLVKTTCWLADEDYRREFVNAYRELRGDGPFPERVTMVAGLPGDCRVAIEAIAAKQSD